MGANGEYAVRRGADVTLKNEDNCSSPGFDYKPPSLENAVAQEGTISHDPTQDV